MKKIFLALAIAGVSLSFVAKADAAAIIGTGNMGLGTTTGNTSDLMTDTLISTTINFITGSGDFSALAIQFVSSATIDTTDLAAFSFGNASFGFFNANAFSFEVLAPVDTRTWDFIGTFTPGTDANYPAGVTSNTAEFVVSVNQVTNPQNGVKTLGGGGPLITPRITDIPEPATLVMLGTFLAPLALRVVRRRRMAK